MRSVSFQPSSPGSGARASPSRCARASTWTLKAPKWMLCDSVPSCVMRHTCVPSPTRGAVARAAPATNSVAGSMAEYGTDGAGAAGRERRLHAQRGRLAAVGGVEQLGHHLALHGQRQRVAAAERRERERAALLEREGGGGLRGRRRRRRRPRGRGSGPGRRRRRPAGRCRSRSRSKGRRGGAFDLELQDRARVGAVAGDGAGRAADRASGRGRRCSSRRALSPEGAGAGASL